MFTIIRALLRGSAVVEPCVQKVSIHIYSSECSTCKPAQNIVNFKLPQWNKNSNIHGIYNTFC